MVRVKICGITTRKDAFAAVDAGADALGFNMIAASPRAIATSAAREIIGALPPMVLPVGVFANQTNGEVRARAIFCRFKAVQLHGDEKPWDVYRLSKFGPVIKAIRVRDAADVARAGAYPRASLLLFDAFHPDRLGGTGTSFRWNLLRGRTGSTRFLLAGGLTPANVASAVRAVRPYGVDVAGGVERSPGKKDAAKVKRFIRAAKDA